jgi:hypothetical protein
LSYPPVSDPAGGTSPGGRVLARSPGSSLHRGSSSGALVGNASPR